MVTPLLIPLITTHEPPSKKCQAKKPQSVPNAALWWRGLKIDFGLRIQGAGLRDVKPSKQAGVLVATAA